MLTTGAGQAVVVGPNSPRTQKAKALMQLGGYLDSMPVLSHSVLGVVVQENKHLADQSAEVRGRWTRLRKDHDSLFLRPCPEVPCPGFIESRRVKAPRWNHVRAMLKQAQHQDPKAELIVMPYLDAHLSAVLTPGRVIIGSGHDGATRGLDTTDIPLVPMPMLPKERAKQLGIAEGEQPHIEMVYTKLGGEQAHLVQVRSGPEVPQGMVNYIPERYDGNLTTLDCQWLKVEPEDVDFLGFEAKLKNLKEAAEKVGQDRPLVVFHEGGSLASHFGLHALANDVGYITERLPTGSDHRLSTYRKGTPVGQVPESQREAFQHGLSVGLSEELTSQVGTSLVTAAIHAVHHASAMLPRQAFLVGLGIAHLFRYGALACAGEARHLISGFDPEPEWPTVVHKNNDRSLVYSALLNNLPALRRTVGTSITLFMDRVRNISRGVGGRPWAQCAGSLVGMEQGIRQCLITRAEDLLSKDIFFLVGASNRMLNQAHNNGWWLNKFTEESVFTAAQKGYYYIPSCLEGWRTALREGRSYRRAVLGFARSVWTEIMTPPTLDPFASMTLVESEVIITNGGNIVRYSLWDQGGERMWHREKVMLTGSDASSGPLALFLEHRKGHIPTEGKLLRMLPGEERGPYRAMWGFKVKDTHTSSLWTACYASYGPGQGGWIQDEYKQLEYDHRTAEDKLFHKVLLSCIRRCCGCGAIPECFTADHLDQPGGWEYLAHHYHCKNGPAPELPRLPSEEQEPQAASNLGVVGHKKESTHVTT